MTREYRILHHRQSGVAGGHWDLVENPIPYRASLEKVPHGEGSLSGALEVLAQERWTPVLSLNESRTQSGETFLLVTRSVE